MLPNHYNFEYSKTLRKFTKVLAKTIGFLRFLFCVFKRSTAFENGRISLEVYEVSQDYQEH